MSSRRAVRRVEARHVPSAFAVARGLAAMIIDWNPVSEPLAARSAVEQTLAGFSRTDLVRTCGQMLTIVRALAYEIPAERRTQVLAELDQLEGLLR